MTGPVLKAARALYADSREIVFGEYLDFCTGDRLALVFGHDQAINEIEVAAFVAANGDDWQQIEIPDDVDFNLTAFAAGQSQ